MKKSIRLLLATLVVLALVGCNIAGGPAAFAKPSPSNATNTSDAPGALLGTHDDAFLVARMNETFIPDTSALVEIQTYREDTPNNEAQVIANLKRIQAYVNQRAETFNAGQKSLRLEPFEWRQEIDGVQRWVFGFRVGNGPRKFSMLTHMDTVPPGNDAWQPFNPRIETKSYRGSEQPFLVGRGALDDKGPGILALTVLEAAAKRFDGTHALDDWTLELSFDTAEETDMNMPFYIDAVGAPELGIVFDAYWCISAEKGGERPVFSMPLGETGVGSLWIARLQTPPGAVNQIPDNATARIEGADPAVLDKFAAGVAARYAAYSFDDPDYRRAPLEIARIDNAVVLTTTVVGAQHGSVPYENRADGANPLVSLANFLAGLVDDGTLATNGYGRMAQFVAWGWGTQVFGEHHPQLLQRYDQIFGPGNGTTYALTRLTTDNDSVNLAIDIRYALGHHSTPYIGATQGILPGDSIFPQIFDELVAQYNAIDPEASLTYTTATLFAPDIRDPNAPQLQTVSAGYAAVMGAPCPAAAIGGGTDAKGHPTLVAAGALFSGDFGPPINFHGLNEGAPIDDLRQSALILYHILLQQVEKNSSGLAPVAAGESAEGDADFEALRDRYFLQSLKLYPVTATYLGSSTYSPELRDIDGKLRDTSQAARDAEVAALRAMQTELAAISPAQLSTQNQIDQRVMRAQIDFLIHQLTVSRHHERAVDTYVNNPFSGVDWQIQGMTAMGDEERGSEDEWALVVARLRAIPAYLENAKANLLDGVATGNMPDRRMVQNTGIDASHASADYFRTALPADAQRYLGSQPFAAEMLTQVTEAGAAAAQAYDDFATFMGVTYDLNETVDRYAIGEEEYTWRLHNNFQVAQSPAELYEYAADRVAQIETETFAVAQQVAAEQGLDLPFGTETEQRTSTLAVMNALSAAAPQDDDELFAWYREIAQKLVQYGRDHDLFDIPDDYQLDIVETPPLLRSAVKAAYFPAPPFKHAGVGRFYLTPTGNDPAALKLNNRDSIADLAAHEGFPGHDWHYKFMTEHANEISNIRWLTPGAVQDSSSMWEDSMAAEGWALYAEQLMAEPQEGAPNGFYSTGEHLYELQGQLWRAARVRIDVGLHTERMGYDEAIDYFTAHVLFYPHACAEAAAGNDDAHAICEQAQREIFRYSQWPTQAITYNLGENAISDLRAAYHAQQGDAYSEKQFHEKLMLMGTIPASYYHDAFLGED